MYQRQRFVLDAEQAPASFAALAADESDYRAHLTEKHR